MYFCVVWVYCFLTTKDFILKELSKHLKGYDLEGFVADLLNAMGYRTTISKHGANDNLIVERRRDSQVVEPFTSGVLSLMQYGDKIIVDSMETMADTTARFADVIFTVVTNGVDVIDQNGQILVDMMTRAAMVPIVVTQRIITRREHASHRRAGIDQAKKKGKYAGRKPIEVDEKLLRQVNQELKSGLITVEEAMRRTKIGSKSTFYRKVRALTIC